MKSPKAKPAFLKDNLVNKIKEENILSQQLIIMLCFSLGYVNEYSVDQWTDQSLVERVWGKDHQLEKWCIFKIPYLSHWYIP